MTGSAPEPRIGVDRAGEHAAVRVDVVAAMPGGRTHALAAIGGSTAAELAAELAKALRRVADEIELHGEV
jgi:hypothetical protein